MAVVRARSHQQEALVALVDGGGEGAVHVLHAAVVRQAELVEAETGANAVAVGASAHVADTAPQSGGLYEYIMEATGSRHEKRAMMAAPVAGVSTTATLRGVLMNRADAFLA